MQVERNLACKCTVLFYILEYTYLYIVQIAKRRIRPMFVFNMQMPDRVECLVVFAYRTCVFLLFLQYR